MTIEFFDYIEKGWDPLSLNPCYNGMTIEWIKKQVVLFVKSLNPCYNGMTIEYSLVGHFIWPACLNPCYNGMTIEYSPIVRDTLTKPS